MPEPKFKSFCDVAAYIHREDVRKADALRKPASLPPRKTGTGPRVAR